VPPPFQLKQPLDNHDEVMNLGHKTVFVYKDVKAILKDSRVSDVTCRTG